MLPFVMNDAVVKLKVSSPPEDGKANAAVIALLSEILQLSKSRLKIIQGEKSRQKRVAISNVSSPEADAILTRLAHAMQSTAESAFQMQSY